MNDHCSLRHQKLCPQQDRVLTVQGPLQTIVVPPWNIPSWGHIFPEQVLRKDRHEFNPSCSLSLSFFICKTRIMLTLTSHYFKSAEASLVPQTVKTPPAMQETWVPSLGQEHPLEKGMATYSRIPAWRIPWTEKSGRL